jgi:hypothetical protein
MRILAPLVVIFGTVVATAQPLMDYHQHLFHPSDTHWAPESGTVTAGELIAFLDAAGIRRALVLSVAYQVGKPVQRFARYTALRQISDEKPASGYKSREACLQRFVHRIDRSDDANAALVEVLAALKLS